MKNLNQIEKIRHSLSHIMSMAVSELYPSVGLGVGPVIENGFYQDYDLPEAIKPEILPKIEKRMREIIKKDVAFIQHDMDFDTALSLYKNDPYKTELIKDLKEAGEKNVSFYKSGEFDNLCAGPHVVSTKEINPDAFKLTTIAGAYWRGNEKNKMLTRIYGVAFDTKEELDTYIFQKEEAEKRDHKKLGKEMGLFVFSDLVGSGLPLWTPKGTIMRELLNDYVWLLRKEKGYMKVTIPHITKKDLYETSGHWTKFADELFKIKTREDHLFAMKPMNCPHHTQIFDSALRSYRDMPQRYAETTMVYRDEQSGELSGLSRVRSITQDDAHVFCRENQIENEMFAIWDIIDKFYTTFGFELQVRFSRHDPDHFEKYIGDSETWKRAEDQIKLIIKNRGVKDYVDGKGEAAMYGPKIDFLAKDSIGRVLQVATIQLDFNMPNRFKLFCTNEKGEREPVVMIHCAIMGSIERFMSTIIEHYAGNFPLWLSPVQVVVIPVRENHTEYAQKIFETLKAASIRAEFADDDQNLGKKVRAAKNERVPYWLVLGDKEVESGTVTLESRDKGQIGQMKIDELLQKFKEEIEEKK